MFLVEYELQEPSVEGRAIDGAAVDAAFDPSYGRFTGERDEPIELPCCQSYVPRNGPGTHHAYATGADWGQRRDWTVIATYRTDTAYGLWWLVAWERTRGLPWPQLLERFNERLRRYPGVAAHDATGMGGNMAEDLLEVEARSVTLAGAKRNGIFFEYIIAMERGELQHPRIDSAWRDHYCVTVEDLYRGGHPPDSFIAVALAWHARGDAPDFDVSFGGSVGSGFLGGLSFVVAMLRSSPLLRGVSLRSETTAIRGTT